MRVLLTGCSSSGKSTLLAALSALDYSTIPEPGRRIVAAERASGGTALPWRDSLAFANRALEMARDDLRSAAQLNPPVFFDRGVLDAAVALEHAGQVPLTETLPPPFPYDLVMLAPPWPEIYVSDINRPHGFEAACAEYDRIVEALGRLDITPAILPRAPVADRAAFVHRTIEGHQSK